MSVTAKSIEECLSIISQLQKEVEGLTAVADACRKRLEGLEAGSRGGDVRSAETAPHPPSLDCRIIQNFIGTNSTPGMAYTCA